MSASQQSPSYDQQVALAIIGAGIANAVTELQVSGPYDLWNTMIGIIILCILQAYKPAPSSHRFLNIAYAATWSFTLLTTCGILFDAVLAIFHIHALSPNDKFYPFNAYDLSFFVTWAVLFGLRFAAFYQLRHRDSIRGTSASQQKPSELGTNMPQANNSEVLITTTHMPEKKV